MDATWTHPKLGEFTYDEDVNTWVGEVATPAFDAFAYDPGYTAAGAYELSFEAENERDKPSAAAVTLAERVIGSADAIVPMVTAALWDDFNGRGPDSGMWWNGDLSTVADMMAGTDLPPPGSADDLLALMQLFRISVRKGVNATSSPSSSCASGPRSSRTQRRRADGRQARHRHGLPPRRRAVQGLTVPVAPRASNASA